MWASRELVADGLASEPRGAHPELLGISIAVPPNLIEQEKIRAIAEPYLEGLEQMLPAFDHAGVRFRHLAKPVSWYLEDHDWVERTAVFEDVAYELIERATIDCLMQAGVEPGEIDGVVFVTNTGITIPTLDVKLANRLGLSPHIERTPIFGLGCAGGATGFARAAQLCRARPGANILLLAVEVCSANLSLRNISKTDAVSAVLFADGASACLLRAPTAGGRQSGTIGGCIASGEFCWPRTERLAGIKVRTDSLGLMLSPSLVPFVRKYLAKATDEFLGRHGYARSDFDGFLFHAGALKIVEAFAQSLELEQQIFASSIAILRDYGNLSACSVLFVLDHALKNGAAGLYLMAALGPGFTVSFVILDLTGRAAAK